MSERAPLAGKRTVRRLPRRPNSDDYWARCEDGPAPRFTHSFFIQNPEVVFDVAKKRSVVITDDNNKQITYMAIP